jgi:hypothetical protein
MAQNRVSNSEKKRLKVINECQNTSYSYNNYGMGKQLGTTTNQDIGNLLVGLKAIRCQTPMVEKRRGERNEEQYDSATTPDKQSQRSPQRKKSE